MGSENNEEERRFEDGLLLSIKATTNAILDVAKRDSELKQVSLALDRFDLSSNRGIKMLEGQQDTTDASVGCESTARIDCEVNGAVMPSAAGTHRSDSGAAQCRA
jgi:hypothetical protein